MKQLNLFVGFLAFIWLATCAFGQQLDMAIGAGTVSAAPTNVSSDFTQVKQTLKGGNFLTISGDALIRGNLGIQGEVSWRTSRTLYAGVLPYRPLFWDFNGIYAPRFNRFLGAEVMAGIGAMSARFYTGQVSCSYISGCTNYTSLNHFMGDFGGGLRLYPFGNFFVRPEARLYLVHGAGDFPAPFSSGHPVRYGISIGYTFGGRSFIP